MEKAMWGWAAGPWREVDRAEVWGQGGQAEPQWGAVCPCHPAPAKPDLVGGGALPCPLSSHPGTQGPRFPGLKGLHHENVTLRRTGHHLGGITFDLIPK